ncbi:hypothetical protein V6N12_059090 [Hibiscus sabdariffa]|uniref:Uncharacterized protein n=1 Tax=Hibiscus sabdariffa TaxID=183260 RepID=A0ABR2EWX2_9ROSI
MIEEIGLSSENPTLQSNEKDDDEGQENKNLGSRISAYAASYDMINVDVASFMATTYSVTAVVAAKEEVKQAVADDLNSTHSSPCEWFICDDDQSATRFSGFETLASWQTNLLFEPVQFEEFDVLVHRGIYEAAKGMYEQMFPEAVTMHSDIVPRAFSCNYPNYAAELLKAINGKFRHLPRLENQKLLYAPMGQILILQLEEKFSPHHHLLPSGTGLYCQVVNCVIRQELKRIRKIGRVHRRKVWWPLILPCEINDGDIILGRLVASQNMHLLVILLFPAKLLLGGAYILISPR